MERIPTTFKYPVVYPNGVVVYCKNEKEQQELMRQIYKYWNEEEDE